MGTTLNILIVDDEPIVRTTLKGFISALGHNVDSATDGREAQQHLTEHLYHLAILDLRMPRINGLQLLEWVHNRNMPVQTIVLTGHGDAEIAHKARVLGARAFLTKPLHLLELDKLIEDVSASLTETQS